MTLPWSSVFRARGVRIAAALHVLLAVILCFVPLFDGLGFERAFATGLLATVTGPVVAVSLLARARARGGASPGVVAGRALWIGALLLLPTVALGWLVEALSMPCDRQEGLLFVLLVAGGNAAFTTGLGLVIGAFTPRLGRAAALIVLTLAVFLGLALYGLYAEPQIFVYSAPFGFWPGSLYDEALEVSAALWAFRGYTALYAGALIVGFVALTDSRRLRLGARLAWRPALLAALLGAGAWMLADEGAELGFDLDERAVQDALSLRLETEHFVIYADPSLPRDQARRLEKEHELRYRQLAEFFEAAPEGKITSYVYASADQKGRLMGAARTQIARPWAHQIHIHGFSVPHRVLKHELAHIFAGELAAPPFRVPAELGILVNIGVVEGVAVAADWPANELTVHGWARAMRSLGLAPDMRTMLGPMGFWSVSSSRAYTVAGSFVRYLYEQHGIEKLGALYRTNDFEAAYGKPLDALVTEWEAFVDALPLPERELVLAEHRFSRPSIFQKVCAHKAANLEQRGHRRLASGDLDGGISDLETLASYRPNDPGPWVAMAEALARAERLDEAERRLERAFEIEGATKKALAQAKETAGGIAWRRTKTETASAAFAEVLELHLSTPSDRLQQARLTALGRPEPAQEVLRPYLLSELAFPVALVRLGDLSRAAPRDGLAHYLYGRALERAEAYREGAEVMGRALEVGLPSRAIEVEAELSLGRLALWAGSATVAAARFDRLAQSSVSAATRIEALDWAARARFWAEARGGPGGK